MLLSLFLTLIAVMSGTLCTYFYDDTDDKTTRAVVVWRVAAGCATGLAWLALAGFVVASAIGMTGLTIIAAAALVVLPAVLLMTFCPQLVSYMRRDARVLLVSTDNGGRRSLLHRMLHRVVWLMVMMVLLAVCLNVYYERANGIYTGFETNLGDMPFHVSIINSFAKGDNFPPQHTEFAGVPLTYPFMADFIAAMFVQVGATMSDALLVENFALMLAFVVLMATWGAEFARNNFGGSGLDRKGVVKEYRGRGRAVGLVSVALVLLSGGLGWMMFLRELFAGGVSNLFTLLGNLSHHYTITGSHFRWGNALIVLLVPQRSLLLGMPLFLIIVTLWWRVMRDNRNNEDARSKDLHLALDAQEPDKFPSAGEAEPNREKSRRDKKRQTTHKVRGEVAEAKYARLRSAHLKHAGELPPAESAAWRWSLDARRMFAAGVMTAMLPLIHAHCFLVVIGAAACLAVLFPVWRHWAIFFVPALTLAAPQLVWAMSGSAVNTSDFIAWQVGWDSRTTNVFLFWLINAGLFLPLLLIALVLAVKNFGKAGGRDESENRFALGWFVSNQALLFYVPFGLLFIATNLLKLSPWVWDNIKMIFCWYVVSVPLVALLIVKAWERAGDFKGVMRVAARFAVFAVFAVLTFAGTLDVWRAVSGAMPQQLFTPDAQSFARIIESQTAPQSLILHAPTYNHPTYLTGRRTLVGYPGHLWTHGLDYIGREKEINRIYANASDRRALIAKYGVNYIAVGVDERAAMKIDEALFNDYKLVGEVSGYRLYEVKP